MNRRDVGPPLWMPVIALCTASTYAGLVGDQESAGLGAKLFALGYFPLVALLALVVSALEEWRRPAPLLEPGVELTFFGAAGIQPGTTIFIQGAADDGAQRILADAMNRRGFIGALVAAVPAPFAPVRILAEERVACVAYDPDVARRALEDLIRSYDEMGRRLPAELHAFADAMERV